MILSDSEVHHVFTFYGGLIAAMDLAGERRSLQALSHISPDFQPDMTRSST